MPGSVSCLFYFFPFFGNEDLALLFSLSLSPSPPPPFLSLSIPLSFGALFFWPPPPPPPHIMRFSKEWSPKLYLNDAPWDICFLFNSNCCLFVFFNCVAHVKFLLFFPPRFSSLHLYILLFFSLWTGSVSLLLTCIPSPNLPVPSLSRTYSMWECCGRFDWSWCRTWRLLIGWIFLVCLFVCLVCYSLTVVKRPYLAACNFCVLRLLLLSDKCFCTPSFYSFCCFLSIVFVFFRCVNPTSLVSYGNVTSFCPGFIGRAWERLNVLLFINHLKFFFLILLICMCSCQLD